MKISLGGQTSLAAAADTLGIGVDDLEFGNLAYFEGSEFTITNDFAGEWPRKDQLVSVDAVI